MTCQPRRRSSRRFLDRDTEFAGQCNDAIVWHLTVPAKGCAEDEDDAPTEACRAQRQGQKIPCGSTPALHGASGAVQTKLLAEAVEPQPR